MQRLMKRLTTILIALFISLSFLSAQSIVPRPESMTPRKGTFRLEGAAVKCDPAMDAASIDAVKRFSARVSLLSGKSASVSAPIGLAQAVSQGSAKGLIFLYDNSLQKEEYILDINPSMALVKAGSLNGFLYALQTLRQLLPASVYGTRAGDGEKFNLPCCLIEDKPRFEYRGMHLDCARHFWSISEIKRYLDVMAMFKLNRFHWHLTDDQGWRLEINSYPLLTQKGAYREGTMIGKDFSSNDGVRYGGSYSQQEVREVVQYAASLGIEVIPEIDLPGHMLAALSAYPYLGCSGGPYQAWTKWGVSPQVLCVGKESTFEFLEAVFSEVCELFPSEYIHIGGDECPKEEWEKCPDCQARIAALGLSDKDGYSAEQYLQNYVIARIQTFLASKGKKIIGWDEILEGELAPGATVMSWRGTAGAKQAAAKGFDVIMTPNSHFYFDYCQSRDSASEPLCIGGYVGLETVYSFDPFEGIAPEAQGRIKGVQANLWTEYISEESHLEYMLLPRMLALSEIQWCAPQNLDYARFLSDLERHEEKVLETAGYNYRKK